MKFKFPSWVPVRAQRRGLCACTRVLLARSSNLPLRISRSGLWQLLSGQTLVHFAEREQEPRPRTWISRILGMGSITKILSMGFKTRRQVKIKDTCLCMTEWQCMHSVGIWCDGVLLCNVMITHAWVHVSYVMVHNITFNARIIDRILCNSMFIEVSRASVAQLIRARDP